MSRWIEDVPPIYLVDRSKPDEPRIKDEDGRDAAPWDVKRYIIEILLPDPAVGGGIDVSLAVDEILELLRDGPTAGYWKLTEAQHKLIKTPLYKPQLVNRNQLAMSQLTKIQRAIRDALHEDPTAGEPTA